MKGFQLASLVLTIAHTVHSHELRGALVGDEQEVRASPKTQVKGLGKVSLEADSKADLRTGSTVCDVRDQGTNFNPSEEGCNFFVMDDAFERMLDLGDGKEVALELLIEDDLNIFHEGPVLFDDALYFNTNRLGITTEFTPGRTAEAQLEQFIEMKKLDFATQEISTYEANPPILMANGMTKTADGQNLLVTSQGFDRDGVGVYEVDRTTLESKSIVTGFLGRNFNSLNDVKTTEDGILFFTDPVYGFEQGFRQGDPLLGSNVYRYDTNTKILSPISTTSLQRPNGLELLDERESGNGCTLFVTDSGFESGGQTTRGFNGFGDAALYSIKDTSNTGCFDPKDGPWPLDSLVPVASGIQDGMVVHKSTKTLLYCDNGDGLWIHSIETARQIGLIAIPCTQLIFPQDDGVNTVYILAEQKLYSVELNFDPSLFDEEDTLSPNGGFCLFDSDCASGDCGFGFSCGRCCMAD